MKTKGWKNVFAFTFIQTVKAKSFIVSTIIMCVIIVIMSAGINLLPGLIAGKESSDSSTGGSTTGSGSISLVYVLDNTGIEGGIDLSPLTELGYAFESIDEADLANKITEVYNSTTAKAIVEMTATDSGYSVLVDRPLDNEIVTSDQCSTLGSYVSSIVKSSLLMSYGVSAENVLNAQASVYSTVTIAGEEPQSMIAQLVNTFVPMISSLVLFMFIFAYGQMVAQAVAIEKTSRVMELLLTSIKPLAVIVGKVLAMCCVSLFQFILLGTAGGISFATLLPFGSLPTMTTGAIVDNVPVSVMDEIGSALSGFNPLNIVLILIIFVLGFLFFALVAGLIGASISKMEDLASAMQPMAILGVLGFYLAYFPSVTEIESTAGDGPNIFTLISYYLPISSPFALPSALITGKLALYEVLISIVVLAVFVVLMAMVVAKVYQHIVLHSGNRLKLSEMLKMAKTK